MFTAAAANKGSDSSLLSQDPNQTPLTSQSSWSIAASQARDIKIENKVLHAKSLLDLEQKTWCDFRSLRTIMQLSWKSSFHSRDYSRMVIPLIGCEHSISASGWRGETARCSLAAESWHSECKCGSCVIYCKGMSWNLKNYSITSFHFPS